MRLGLALRLSRLALRLRLLAGAQPGEHVHCFFVIAVRRAIQPHLALSRLSERARDPAKHWGNTRLRPCQTPDLTKSALECITVSAANSR